MIEDLAILLYSSIPHSCRGQSCPCKTKYLTQHCQFYKWLKIWILSENVTKWLSIKVNWNGVPVDMVVSLVFTEKPHFTLYHICLIGITTKSNIHHGLNNIKHFVLWLLVLNYIRLTWKKPRYFIFILLYHDPFYNNSQYLVACNSPIQWRWLKQSVAEAHYCCGQNQYIYNNIQKLIMQAHVLSGWWNISESH